MSDDYRKLIDNAQKLRAYAESAKGAPNRSLREMNAKIEALLKELGA